jgi:two-component system, LytTR family, sensor kinase
MTSPIHKHRFRFYLFTGGLWLLLWLISLVNSGDTFEAEAYNEAWRTIYFIIVNYLFFEYALPVILEKRSAVFLNILAGALFIFIHLLLVSGGLAAWNALGTGLGIFSPMRETHLIPGGNFNSFVEEALYQGQSGLASVLFFGGAKLIHYNTRLKRVTQQLRLEKQEAELNYLRSQTNPHFLFNTLNNIYSLAQDRSELAAESILRLSKILRFMLYETGARFITIEQELDIISDYISLEKLRYDETLRVMVNHTVEDMKQPLPPLLLIPLVENAFKHGTSETGLDPFVDIDLVVNAGKLTFVVKNSAGQVNDEMPLKENIGLSNLRRQLELLYADHKLSAYREGQVFTAVLQIDLRSHV